MRSGESTVKGHAKDKTGTKERARSVSARERTTGCERTQEQRQDTKRTSLIMSSSSAWVGFWPSERMTVPSSLVVMVPSPSAGNNHVPTTKDHGGGWAKAREMESKRVREETDGNKERERSTCQLASNMPSVMSYTPLSNREKASLNSAARQFAFSGCSPAKYAPAICSVGGGSCQLESSGNTRHVQGYTPLVCKGQRTALMANEDATTALAPADYRVANCASLPQQARRIGASRDDWREPGCRTWRATLTSCSAMLDCV